MDAAVDNRDGDAIPTQSMMVDKSELDN